MFYSETRGLLLTWRTKRAGVFERSPVPYEFSRPYPFVAHGGESETASLVSVLLRTSPMPQARLRPQVEPRGYTLGEVAHYLGHPQSWLTPARLAELQRHGFPQVDPLLQRIDRRALDIWWNARSGLLPTLDDIGAGTPTSSDENPWRKAFHDEHKDSARHRHS